jgi:hypothetical protein
LVWLEDPSQAVEALDILSPSDMADKPMVVQSVDLSTELQALEVNPGLVYLRGRNVERGPIFGFDEMQVLDLDLG